MSDISSQFNSLSSSVFETVCLYKMNCNNVGGNLTGSFNGASLGDGNQITISKNKIFYSFFSKSSVDDTRPVYRRKYDIPEPHDYCEAGLINLWGEDTLKQLRQYVRAADIEDHHIRTMASKMGVRRIYNENCHKVNLVETFERMLEEWFNQNLFDLRPSEAKDELVKVMTDARCSERIISGIQRLCDKNRL